MIAVAIVDDHPISRWGMRLALESAPEMRVVGTYCSPGEVSEAGQDVDVMVLDLFLADNLPCLDVIRQYTGRTRVMVVSASRLPADIEASFHAGAHGYVHKGVEPEVLVSAVRDVAAGGSARLVAGAPAVDDASHPSLSMRERQVLHFIANGYTHEQAARRLGISPHTVETYVKRLRAKLGVGNKAHLTRVALLRYTPTGSADM